MKIPAARLQAMCTPTSNVHACKQRTSITGTMSPVDVFTAACIRRSWRCPVTAAPSSRLRRRRRATDTSTRSSDRCTSRPRWRARSSGRGRAKAGRKRCAAHRTNVQLCPRQSKRGQ
eukprot:5102078-Pleurochrysis_carterae.AAC.12